MAPVPIETLLALMARLRDPNHGCPWDRAQTFATIAPYTIEEAYEVADAIARNDRTALVDELGDLLFQVVFHAHMAEEAGDFSFADVVGAITEKMIRRHPHVFSPSADGTPPPHAQTWEAHKAAERAARAALQGEQASALDGVPRALPALSRAVKLQKRLQRVGFDFTRVEDVIAKLREELRELEAELENGAAPARVEDELGDLLFACANLGRFLAVDPERALARTNDKVERRFRAIEAELARQGLKPEDVDLETLDRLWDTVKREEAAGRQGSSS